MDKSMSIIGIIAVVVVIAVAGVFLLTNFDNSKEVHTSEPHVEFYGNEGLTSDGKEFIDSAMDTALPGNMFTRDGYDFVSWNTQSNGSGTSYDPYDTVTMGMKLYAQWEKHVDRITTSINVSGSSSYFDSITYVSGDNSYKYTGTFYPAAGDYIAFTPSSDYTPVVYDNGFRAVKYVDNMSKGYFITVSLTDGSGNEMTLDLSVKDGVGKISVPTDKSTRFSISVSFGQTSDAVFNSNSSSSDITCSVDCKTDGSGCKYYTGRSTYSQDKFSWAGHYVKSWNTARDGSGTSYGENDRIPYADNEGTLQTVYAQWAQRLEYSFAETGSSVYSDLEYTFECGSKSIKFYKVLSPSEELEITGLFNVVIKADGIYCKKITKESDTVYSFEDIADSAKYKLELSYGSVTPASVTLSDDGTTVTLAFDEPSSDSACSVTLTFTKKTA